MKKKNINHFLHMKNNEEKIAALTAYDAVTGQICDQNQIDIILVGDSLGMVIQGHNSTLPVTVDQMVYHTENVARVTKNSFIIADMPFGSYINENDALKNAVRLIQAGANMVKMEGGSELASITKKMLQNGIPVCAHLGLMPQSINSIGSYSVQGKEEHKAQEILEHAELLMNAGAQLLVLECIPARLAATITAKLPIPTIGIGAGPDTDGQILVTHDMLGLTTNNFKFCKSYCNLSPSNAILNYVSDVKNKQFPTMEYTLVQ